jgi:hypothetical protein
MTNATVKEVMTDATVIQVGGAAGAPIIKLSFHGASAPEHKIAPAVRRMRQAVQARDASERHNSTCLPISSRSETPGMRQP